MKPARFAYARPETVDDAVGLLAEHEGGARVLAGGQSLVPMLHMRLMQPSAVVDINRLVELDHIEPDGDDVVIGALTRYSTLERSDLVADRLPLVRDVVRYVGDRQIRNRGTIGGALAQADPVGEIPLACLALDATVVARGTGGTRDIPIADFVLGPYTTALEPGELLVEVRIPRQPGPHRFFELGRRHNDFAVIAIAVVGTRIAIAGGDDRPILVEGSVEDVLGVIDPPDDVRASAEYRRHLIGVHLERLLRV